MAPAPRWEARWTRAQTQTNGVRIPARGGHSCVSADMQLVVFGGHYYEGAHKFEYLNDVWLVDAEKLSWQPVQCSGTPPEPRYSHCCQLVGSRMFVIGGKGRGSKLFRDVWFLDLLSWTWYPVHPTTIGPTARFGHASTLVGRKIVVHGGWNGSDTCYGDLWVFNTESFSWLQPKTGGIAPCARFGHQLVLVPDGRLLCFGGASTSAQQPVPEYQSDLRQLDTETMAWSKPRTQGLVPAGRYGHTLTLLQHQQGEEGGQGQDGGSSNKGGGGVSLVLYGGWGMGGLQAASVKGGTAKKSSVAVMDVAEEPQLVDVEVPATVGGEVVSRHGHTCCVVGSTVFVFGGWDAQQALSDLLMVQADHTRSEHARFVRKSSTTRSADIVQYMCACLLK
ncbi:hypothetical protein JKP88DRAFT_255581 [Tribonema minus]|uniref:Uncharacterized protein n=1 Tax=Tribonema minus TaxID=303371 RepID=A0A836CGB4_9STRA|nr:hypothetical protein JKP88DRAFT_255581 [Tribonema minus]